jgi:broad specificity phosphatase PhoE
MAQIYLIRHAKTRQEPGVPAERWTLSEEGFIAAGALAGKQFWTTVGRVITSTEVKTLATVTPALELWGIPHEAWAEFDEVQRGGFAATQEEYETRVRQLFAAPDESGDGWEPAAHALERALAGLNRALAEYPGQNLAIVGHGLLWALVRAHVLGKERVEPAEWKAVQFPDVMVWEVTGGEWRLGQEFEGIRKLGGLR